MSECLAAEIQIGGKVRRRVAEELCDVIATERLALDWGDARFEPKTIDDLLAGTLRQRRWPAHTQALR